MLISNFENLKGTVPGSPHFHRAVAALRDLGRELRRDDPARYAVLDGTFKTFWTEVDRLRRADPTADVLRSLFLPAFLGRMNVLASEQAVEFERVEASIGIPVEDAGKLSSLWMVECLILGLMELFAVSESEQLVGVGDEDAAEGLDLALGTPGKA